MFLIAMPDQIYIIIATVFGLSLLFLYLAITRLTRKKVLTGSINFLIAACMILLCIAIVLFVANIYTYQKLSHEETIATVRFTMLARQRYRAHVYNIKENRAKPYMLHGDQWQIDARVIKWKPIGLLLGLNTLYRLERLSGRYIDIHDEQSKPRAAHNLAQNAGIELWKMADTLKHWLPLLDNYYGSAAYMPLADNAHYNVMITINGVMIRPANDIAEKAVSNW